MKRVEEKIHHGVTESTETHGEARMASGVVSEISVQALLPESRWEGRAKRGPTTSIWDGWSAALRAVDR